MSYENKFLKQGFKQPLIANTHKYNYESFNSADFVPEHFGVGKFTEIVLEEITEEQDDFEVFFTIMFLLGFLLIPLQLVFSDTIKPYDLVIIQWMQDMSKFNDPILIQLSECIGYFLDFSSTFTFHTSFTIFIYLSIDPGIAYKAVLTSGLASYLNFFLISIIHDSRPYWISDSIIPTKCHITYGCPSLNVLSGILYYHYMNFSISRALQSNDPFIEKNREALEYSRYLVEFYVIINIMIGAQSLVDGEHFIYQILATFFYGFIIIRILIMFNKNIDYVTNGSRYMKEISNTYLIWILFFVLTLSCFSALVYSIIANELYIDREWSTNINVSFIKVEIMPCIFQ